MVIDNIVRLKNAEVTHSMYTEAIRVEQYRDKRGTCGCWCVIVLLGMLIIALAITKGGCWVIKGIDNCGPQNITNQTTDFIVRRSWQISEQIYFANE